MTALLLLIYTAFISLGIPDSLLGATWPAMHADLGLDISLAGILSIICGTGTVVSSLLSARWIARFGTGRVTAISVLATAISLFGYSQTRSFGPLLLLSIPLGLGAGAVDSGLNNFVALHYQAKHMNWLHSFWGVGATIGPAMVGALLATTGNWRYGYGGMAALQAMLGATLFLTLPLWKRAGEKKGRSAAQKSAPLSLREIIRKPLAKPVFLSLLCYCGAESTMGLWGASYLVGFRGIAPDIAATWVAAFFAGITFGRVMAGLLTFRWNNPQMIRLGQGIALTGIVVLFLPLPAWSMPIAFFLVGTGFAPIFPAIMHQTPRTFGSEASQSMMGVEMAFAYVGNICMPPLFGWISSGLSLGILAFYLALLMLAMVGCTEYVKKKAERLQGV